MVGGVPLGGLVVPAPGVLVLPRGGVLGVVCGVDWLGVVSGVGLVGAVSGVGVVFGVVSGVAVAGGGAAVSGGGLAGSGVGATVPGAGLGVWDCGAVLGVAVCGAGAAVCAMTQIAVKNMHEISRAFNFIGVLPPISILVSSLLDCRCVPSIGESSGGSTPKGGFGYVNARENHRAGGGRVSRQGNPSGTINAVNYNTSIAP